MKKMLLLIILSTLFLGCSKKRAFPIYDYYKNIPVIRGWTNDDKPKNFMIEVVLVYRENNSELRTVINTIKPTLIDSLRKYLSSLKEEDYLLSNQDNVKKEAVLRLNEVILRSMSPKKADKIRKQDVQDLLLDINILQLQIFSLD